MNRVALNGVLNVTALLLNIQYQLVLNEHMLHKNIEELHLNLNLT